MCRCPKALYRPATLEDVGDAARAEGTNGAGSAARLVAAYGLYYLDNRPFVLRAAELPYHRVPRHQWPAQLAALREAGFTAIAADLPWSWHEPEPGRLDFTGETHPERALLELLEQIDRCGLVFIARAGPQTVAPPAGGGLPPWLAQRIPEALARGPDGEPLAAGVPPCFSLLHPAYLAQIERWYAAVAGALAPYTGAPVVAWQLHDARAQRGASPPHLSYPVDFNPATVARYHRFLEQRYEQVALLERDWRRTVGSFERALPPTGPCTPAELGDWKAFLEEIVATHLDRLRQIVRQLGVALPLAVAGAARPQSPANPRLVAPVGDFYGFDATLSAAGTNGGAVLASPPFGGSLEALCFAPFATDERPPTAWRLSVARAAREERGRTSLPEPSALLLHAVAGALAHGVKGYCLALAPDPAATEEEQALGQGQPWPSYGPYGPPDLAGTTRPEGRAPPARSAGGSPNAPDLAGTAASRASSVPVVVAEPLARLQAFLAAREEELTASVEVHDAVAFVTYQPYTRVALAQLLHRLGSLLGDDRRPLNPSANGRVASADAAGAAPEATWLPWLGLGFLALMLATGYNPTVVDLESITDEELAEFPAAVFPSAGYLDLDSYGKLVVFTLRGGHLVTFPEPVTCEPDGAPFRSTFLWPLRPERRLWLSARQSPLRQWSGHVARWLPLARPRGEATPAGQIGWPATRLRREAGSRADDVLAEHLVVEYPPGGMVLLRHGKAPAGYQVRVRDGLSTVLGTWPGAAYATSRYYALSAAQRRALRRLVIDLFTGQAPRQIVPDDSLEIEVVARLSPDGGCLLFVLNRLGAQAGCLHLPNPAALNLGQRLRAELLYSAFGSRVIAGEGHLRLALAPRDVVIARVW